MSDSVNNANGSAQPPNANQEIVSSNQPDEHKASAFPEKQFDPETVRKCNATLVRNRLAGATDLFDSGDLHLIRQDQVVVETEHGIEIGTVVVGPTPTQSKTRLPRVLRLVNDDDRRLIERNRIREREAFLFCEERIKAENLNMKLISTELAHSGTKIVFNFSSPDRIDFRGLVKDLARRFHTRIEMRQIGVRDAARHTGGLGICGRELCCATFLGAFKPISIRMAKDQNLTLSQQKLSGFCGRLRCCLEYEQNFYQEQRKGLPKVGKRVITPQGEARIKDVDVLQRRVRVQFLEGGFGQFNAEEITRPTDINSRPEGLKTGADAWQTPEPTKIAVTSQPQPQLAQSRPQNSSNQTAPPSDTRNSRKRRRRRNHPPEGPANQSEPSTQPQPNNASKKPGPNSGTQP